MDPNAALQLFQSAVQRGDWEAALEALTGLKEWRDIEGFDPKVEVIMECLDEVFMEMSLTDKIEMFDTLVRAKLVEAS